MDEDRIEQRVSNLEREVAELRGETRTARADAAASRILSAGADHDVSEVRAELRAHTGAMNALRETQVEHGRELIALRTEMDAGFAAVDAGFARVDAGFAAVDAGFAQMNAQFRQVDAEFAKVDTGFRQVESQFGTVNAGLAQIVTLLTPPDGDPGAPGD